ncbi:low temperature requirement protein A [Leifsonia sp. NPDC058292]|uniref:low temperature requirement protein A n=1 Tax=Leifsonia sp. NPDC058292 TaxID=3346428 RepID=UPI0036DF4994
MAEAVRRRRGAWRTPELRDDGREPHRVGWLELFFDLVFVVIVAVLAADLDETHDLLAFSLQFFAVFWVWNAFTYYTERFESDGIEGRLFTFVGIVAVAGLAVWGHDGLGTNYIGFASSYLLARVLNIALWLRAGYYVSRFRRASLGFLGGFLVAAALLIVSFFVPAETRLTLWAAAVLVEIVTPAITGRLQVGLPPITEDKFPERFGLFTMIVLGETVAEIIQSVATANAVERLSALTISDAVLGLAIGFGMWWVYYDFIARRPVRPRFFIALGWVYLHMAMLLGIVVVGVGIALALHAPGDPMEPFPRLLLFGGLGLTLVTIAAIETTLMRAPDEPTNAVISPALKAGVGLIMVALAAAGAPLTATEGFVVALAALAVPATYGAIVWYRTN